MLTAWIESNLFGCGGISAVLLPLRLPPCGLLEFFHDDRAALALVRGAELGRTAFVSTFLPLIPETVLRKHVPPPLLNMFGAAVYKAIVCGHADTLAALCDDPRLSSFPRETVTSALHAALRSSDVSASCVARVMDLRSTPLALNAHEKDSALHIYMSTFQKAQPMSHKEREASSETLKAFVDHCFFLSHDIIRVMSWCTPALAERLEQKFPKQVFDCCLTLLRSRQHVLIAEASLQRIITASMTHAGPTKNKVALVSQAMSVAIEDKYRELLTWLLQLPCACKALLNSSVLRSAIVSGHADVVALILADPRAVPFANAAELALRSAKLFPIADLLLADRRVVPVCSHSWDTAAPRFRENHRVIPSHVIKMADFVKTCMLPRAVAVRAAREDAKAAGQGVDGKRNEAEAKARVTALLL